MEPPIRIAWVDLDGAAAHASELAPLLDDDERRSAARAADPVDQLRRLTSRAALRLILARTVGRSAATLRFSLGTHGKPELVGPENVYFSVSHSRGLAAIAVAKTIPIGIDIEYIASASEDIVEGALSAAERDALARLEGSARDRAFTRSWVRKEAILKAAGVGLSIDPRSLTVPNPELDGALALSLPASLGPASEWFVTDLATCHDVRGALAHRTREAVPYAEAHEDISLHIKHMKL